jgi:general secretion pathway protein N
MARRRVRDRPAPEAPVAAKKLVWLIGLGLVAVLLFTVFTLPSSLLSGPLQRAGFDAPSLSGSVWSGRAAGLSWRGVALGDLQWRVSGASLFRGRIAGNVNLSRPDGSASSRVAATFGGDLHFEATQVDLPVEALSALPIGVPKGWRGRVTAHLEELAVSGGWPTVVRGTLDMNGLVAPPPRNAAVGSFHVVMPDPQGSSTPGDALTARVADKEGPFSVDARLTLSRDRSFLLEGTLAPRGNTPPELERSLQLLGPADAAGRRPFSVSGTL